MCEKAEPFRHSFVALGLCPYLATQPQDIKALFTGSQRLLAHQSGKAAKQGFLGLSPANHTLVDEPFPLFSRNADLRQQFLRVFAEFRR